MIETITTDNAPSPSQCDSWRRLWEVLLQPEPEQPTDEQTEGEDQEG